MSIPIGRRGDTQRTMLGISTAGIAARIVRIFVG